MKNRKYLSLTIWVLALIAIGSIIGSLTKPEISEWYMGLNRSPLTPPDYVFPLVWTILYGGIGAAGWVIWGTLSVPKLRIIKTLYIIQLILNWSWTPLFFHYHLMGLGLLVLGGMGISVGMLMRLTYSKLRTVWLLMLPYLWWILFASYLNGYIWQHN